MAPYVHSEFQAMPPDKRRWRIVVTDAGYVLEMAGTPDAMGNPRWQPFDPGRNGMVPAVALFGLANLVGRQG